MCELSQCKIARCWQAACYTKEWGGGDPRLGPTDMQPRDGAWLGSDLSQSTYSQVSPHSWSLHPQASSFTHTTWIHQLWQVF